MNQQLSLREFKTIYKKVPRLCVDAVVKTRAGLLLVKRDITPWKGKWHLPGGTVRFSEKIEDAVKRIIREETGLVVRLERMVGVIEYIHVEGGKRTHAVGVVFLTRPVGGKLRGSPQGREVRYFSRFPNNMISEQKTFLKKHRRIIG